MIRKLKITEVPNIRKEAPIRKIVESHLSELKTELDQQDLGPFEVREVVLDTNNPKTKGALLQLLKTTKNWIKAERLPYVAFSRTDPRSKTRSLYVARKEDSGMLHLYGRSAAA